MKRGSLPEQTGDSDGASDTAHASHERSMSIHNQTGKETAGTHREYRFKDSRDSAVVVPDSWAQTGHHEEGDGERFYAVEVRVGRRFEYTVDHTGATVAGPHRDEPAIETLYVSADGGRAVVLESQAVETADAIQPHAEWRSVLVDPDAEISTVAPKRRDAYRSLIRDLYEVGN